MASKSTPTLNSLMSQRDQLDNRIAAKKQTLATSIGTPFVTKFGDEFTAKDAAQFAAAIEKLGPRTALAKLQ